MTLKAESFRLGAVSIHPKGAPAPIDVVALRIYGQRIDKPSKETFWDITQSAAVAAVLPFLENAATMHQPITFRGRGYGPRKTLTIEVGVNS